MRNNYAPKTFSKENVLLLLQSYKDNRAWRKANLPLSESLKKTMDTDMNLIDELMSDVREMTRP